jgi:hypothetical protein
MKKAVVFFGSMRELEMGSKTWHLLGENVDYFVVTWDVVNNHFTDDSNVSSYPCDLSNFPVPLKGTVRPNFSDYTQYLQNLGLQPNAMYPNVMLYVLYHWSLISLLPDIHTYDQIIITRTDMFCVEGSASKWEPNIVPGKVTFIGVDRSVNDWIVTTDPAGLATLYDIYHTCIDTRGFLDEFGNAKLIHDYLYEKIQANPEKFLFNNVKVADNPTMPPTVLVRPNYPKAWLKLSYGPVLAYLMIRHSQEYENLIRGITTGADDITIQMLSTSKFSL